MRLSTPSFLAVGNVGHVYSFDKELKSIKVVDRNLMLLRNFHKLQTGQDLPKNVTLVNSDLQDIDGVADLPSKFDLVRQLKFT